ncbi:hypothetical protein J7412_01620 [Shimia sp. R9_3]|nr:hypothetical protein [Shimia sp. R9_3]
MLLFSCFQQAHHASEITPEDPGDDKTSWRSFLLIVSMGAAFANCW